MKYFIRGGCCFFSNILVIIMSYLIYLPSRYTSYLVYLVSTKSVDCLSQLFSLLRLSFATVLFMERKYLLVSVAPISLSGTQWTFKQYFLNQ